MSSEVEREPHPEVEPPTWSYFRDGFENAFLPIGGEDEGHVKHTGVLLGVDVREVDPSDAATAP
jgi:hypothetical protein